MKNVKISLEMVFVVSVFVFSLAVVPLASSNAQTISCTNQVLDRQILDTGISVNTQTLRNFTQTSTQYEQVVAGYNASFLGISYLWTFSNSNCSVALKGFGVNYLLLSQNNSRYTLTFSETPSANEIYNTTINAQFIANLYSGRNQSVDYSGYGVADNSAHSTQVDYSQAYWFVPTIYTQTGQTCGTYSAGTACEEAVWVGLQNTTYDGWNRIDGNGEVIQTGTEGYIQNCASSCWITYDAWYAYLAGTSGGTIDNNTLTLANCGSKFTPAAGDEMSGVVGSQLEINGTSGDKYYTLLTDETQSKICESVVTFSHTNEKYGKEYYADYFLERLQTGASSGFHLAKFSAVTFYDMAMGSSGSSFGAYPEYNSGYGFSSYMYNSASDTAINPWVLNSGSTVDGTFNTTFTSSSGT